MLFMEVSTGPSFCEILSASKFIWVCILLISFLNSFSFSMNRFAATIPAVRLLGLNVVDDWELIRGMI